MDAAYRLSNEDELYSMVLGGLSKAYRGHRMRQLLDATDGRIYQ